MYSNEFCLNCNSPVSEGNQFIEKWKTAIIHVYEEFHYENYCEKCGKALFAESIEKLKEERNELSNFISENINSIPAVTNHNPYYWHYKIKGIVTAQAVTKPGVLTSFGSETNDFFGIRTPKPNYKIKEAELNCFNQLRVDTIKMGGNAIVSVNIDYKELKDSENSLMICISGTAVDLTNAKGMLPDRFESINELFQAINRLNFLESFESKLTSVAPSRTVQNQPQ